MSVVIQIRNEINSIQARRRGMYDSSELEEEKNGGQENVSQQKSKKEKLMLVQIHTVHMQYVHTIDEEKLQAKIPRKKVQVSRDRYVKG